MNPKKAIKNLFFTSVSTLALISCKPELKSDIIYLYPKDKSQTVTVLSDYLNNKRIIAVGKHTSKPESDYIELDISKITKLGDEIGICWEKNGHKWEIANDKAEIVSNELDTTMYVFRNSWFKDEDGIPNAKYYREDNCFTVGTFNKSEHYPTENGTVDKN